MTYDVQEIVEANEQLKKEKHFLEKTPIRRNRTRGSAADSPKAINRILPSKEKEAKKADEFSLVFNTTTRAGAGGTRLGVPGIRPSGGKAASQFLENFTGVGRFKPQPAPLEAPLKIEETRNDNARGPSVVLYRTCMDCLLPVDRDACVPNMSIVPPPENCAPAVTHKWQSVNLKPGSILCYLFCLKCVKEAQAVSKDPSKQIHLISGGQEITLAQQELKARGERISDQVFGMIKNERNNPDSDIFYGSAKDG